MENTLKQKALEVSGGFPGFAFGGKNRMFVCYLRNFWRPCVEIVYLPVIDYICPDVQHWSVQ